MIPYYLIFLTTTLMLALYYSSKNYKLLYIIGFIILLIFIGGRWKVGGDWGTYLMYLERAHKFKWQNLSFHEPGYILINIISSYITSNKELGIVIVNTISGFIFLYGLFKFIDILKYYRIIAFMTSFPYLLTVISMGYTRQSIAIGIIFLSLYDLFKEKYNKSILKMCLAILFHRSSIFMLMIFLMFLLIKTRKKFLFLIGFFLVILLLYIYQTDIYSLYYRYVVKKMISFGAIYRNILFSFYIFIFVIIKNRLYYIDKPFIVKFWDIIIIIALILISSMPILGKTTTDRLMLYLYPFQIYVSSRFLYILRNSQKPIISILFFYFSFIQLVIWLFFAIHRHAWIPYQNFLFLNKI